MSEKRQKLNAEVDAVALAAAAQAKADAAKIKVAALHKYEGDLKAMPFRQLRAELRRESRRPSDSSALTSGYAAVMLAVLENTQTRENPFAKLSAYLR